VALHFVGKFFSSVMPVPSGPRHAGQLAARAAAMNSVKAASVGIREERAIISIPFS
jgi:hypothetical protein